MRLKLIFELEKEMILKDYRRKFISFFKQALEGNGNGIREKYYGTDKKSKDYTFSTYFQGKFLKDGIKIEDKKIILNFSTANMEEGIHFTNGFIGAVNKSFEFGDNMITLKKVEMYNEKPVKESGAEFRILSPIVVKERDNELVEGKRKNRDIYYSYKDEKWLDVLKENMKYQLKDKFDYDISYDIDSMEIVAEEPFVKKTVVENYGVKFQVTLGRIYIKGEKELLGYLSKSGLGGKRSSGFGMLELV